MFGEKERDQLERHIQEAEERATVGGHILGPWNSLHPADLFVREAVCTRCGEKVQAGYTALYVGFASQCPGEGG